MKKGGIVGLVRVMLLVSTIVIAIGAAPILLRLPIAAEAKVSMTLMYSGPRASMAVSGNNNIYLTWWDNKTGNNEVYFGGSNDGGKTFGSPINISNSPDARSVGARMIAQGNNVYVAWMDLKPGQKQVMFRAVMITDKHLAIQL